MDARTPQAGKGRRRTANVVGAIATTRAAAIATTTFAVLRRPSPACGVLATIAHPPNLPALIVAHEQRTIRRHGDSDGPSPARAVGPLPSRDEIFDRGGLAASDAHPHDFCAGGHRAIPRAVVG